MTNETATAVTDVALSVGTFFLGITVGKSRTWIALFLMLALAAGLGAIYHGIEKFHTREFWPIVAATSSASSFLFLAACLCTARPRWKWLQWLWPLFGLVGILWGVQLAPFPFWYISVTSVIIILISLLALHTGQAIDARRWIYMGVAISLVGLAVQKFTHGSGLFSGNALFHELQLAGNFFLWVGARRT